MGANGSILGPKLITQKGDDVDISVLNNLGETSTIHWHGMHVSVEKEQKFLLIFQPTQLRNFA